MTQQQLLQMVISLPQPTKEIQFDKDILFDFVIEHVRDGKPYRFEDINSAVTWLEYGDSFWPTKQCNRKVKENTAIKRQATKMKHTSKPGTKIPKQFAVSCAHRNLDGKLPIILGTVPSTTGQQVPSTAPYTDVPQQKPPLIQDPSLAPTQPVSPASPSGDSNAVGWNLYPSTRQTLTNEEQLIDPSLSSPIKKPDEEPVLVYRDKGNEEDESMSTFIDFKPLEVGCNNNPGEQMVPTSELNEMTNTSENRSTSASKAKPHKCTICEYFASWPSQLQAHMRRHTGEKPFECERCPKRFALRTSLNRHMKIHVTDTEVSWKCSMCWQMFATTSELLDHKLQCKRHYECHLCKAYSTSRITHLTVHMRVHSGVRPFQCRQCQKKFKQNNHLDTHMKNIHTNPRPLKYRCSVCVRLFLKHSDKDAHQMNCKRRRYECYLCQIYKTHSKMCLQEHMRNHHTGERPFKCSLCEKFFTFQRILNWHIKKIHKSN